MWSIIKVPSLKGSVTIADVREKVKICPLLSTLGYIGRCINSTEHIPKYRRRKYLSNDTTYNHACAIHSFPNIWRDVQLLGKRVPRVPYDQCLTELGGKRVIMRARDQLNHSEPVILKLAIMYQGIFNVKTVFNVIPPYNSTWRSVCPKKIFHWEAKVNLFWTFFSTEKHDCN